MDKETARNQLVISSLILRYGGRKGRGRNIYHCFRHEDKKASLIADDRRGVATCMSPKCDLKRGSDIFAIIQTVERCDFKTAVNKAFEYCNIQPLEQVAGNTKVDSNLSLSKTKKLDVIPELCPLTQRHFLFLKGRFRRHALFIKRHFRVSSYFYHIAIPINNGSFVFLPTQSKDSIFYRGKIRSCQLFPFLPNEQSKATKIFVCEGEKDVLMATAELHSLGLLEWSVITNTNGASSVKVDTPLFVHFDKNKVEKVVICYDNDEAGKSANAVVYKNAQSYFNKQTTIKIVSFEGKPKGYDITDYLLEKH